MDQSVSIDNARDHILQLFGDEELLEVRKALEEYRYTFGKDEFYYHILSDSYLDQAKYETALKLLQEARLKGYSSYIMNQAMAEAYFGLERYQEALDELMQIDDSAPEWTPLVFDLRAMCYEGMQDYRHAVQCYEDFLMEEEDPEVLVRAGLDYLYLGNEERGREYIERFFRISEDGVFEEIYFPLIRLGYPDLAGRFLKRIIRNQDLVDEMIMTTTFVVQDRKDEAIKYLTSKLKTEPTTNRYAILASLYNQTDQPENEKKAFRKILSIPVSVNGDMQISEDLHHRLIALHQLNYTKNTIRKYLQKYTSQYAQNLECRLQLMEFALDHDCYTEMFDLMKLDMDYEQMPQNLLQAYERLYVSYLKKTEQYNRLYEHMRESLYLHEDPALRFDYAMTACRIGLIEEGIEIFQDLLPDGYSAIMLMKIYDLYGMDKEKRNLKKYMEDITQSISSLDIDGYQEYVRFLHNYG